MVLPAPTDSAPDRELPREVRIALVLYGGVSLAVYENGVTRCFYELVRGRGPLGFVAKLLGAKVAVDVIAGSSAGGINGLLLAAALENGTEFAGTAALWRELGDLGSLLRPISDSRTARSLLAGESWYQQNLERAFEELCDREKSRSPVVDPAEFEMDVFVTGTDLAGRDRCYSDATGSTVHDRYHRTVFHLKYRPERRCLGCRNGDTAPARGTQARVLASIARITSTFPGAFPPFLARELSRDADGVSEALRATGRFADEDGVADRLFLDGGVLSNKPFGPALRAIFHRMPKLGVVDRRLFYVEPDPDPGPAQRSAVAGIGPFLVPLRAVRLPGHESIGEQLAELRDHNAQLAWLSATRAAALRAAGSRGADVPSALYLSCRLDALALALLARDEDRGPAASDMPQDEEEAVRFRALVSALRSELEDRPGVIVREYLDPFDVDYHLRRAFHLLYALHGRLEADDAMRSDVEQQRLLEALTRTGRIVKALKLVRDQLVVLRNALARGAPDAMPPAALIGLLRRFLADDAPQWRSLRRATFEDPFPREALTEAATAAAPEIASLVAESPALLAASPPVATVITRIAAELDETAGSVRGEADGDESALSGEELLRRFDAVDDAVFPLQFAGGLYELDRIELVRVSPVDAQLGLSKGRPQEKISGDALGHFAAFLRRDWRANDLFVGRLDGACQIVRGLVDDDAMSRLERRIRTGRSAGLPDFAPDALAGSFPGCPTHALEALSGAWDELVGAWKRVRDGAASAAAAREAEDRFREALVLAIHGSFFAEDRLEILADRATQDLLYDGEGGDADLEARARATARAALDTWPEDDLGAAWERYQALGLGASGVRSRAGVPTQFLLQYAVRAILFASGMFEQTFASQRAVGVLRWPFALLVRLPLRGVHGGATWVSSSHRRWLRSGWRRVADPVYGLLERRRRQS